MPSGLPEVVQPVGADTSRYVQEFRAARAETAALIADNQQLLRTMAEVQAVMGRGPAAGPGAAAAADVARMNAEIREGLRLLGDHSRVIADVTAAGRQFGGVQAEIAGMVRESGAAIRETTAAVGGFSAAQAEAIRVGRETTNVLGDLAGGFEGVRAAGTGAGDAVVTNLARVRDTARDATSGLTDTAAAITAVSTAADSGKLAQVASGDWAALALAGAMRNASNAARTAATLGATSAAEGILRAQNTLAALPPGLGGTGGGGGGGAGPLLGAAAGGAAGGGGAGGGFLGGLIGSGAADRQWSTVASAIATWYPRIHYALMATNELLATAGPAAIALAAGAAVGMQGGQQLYNRGRAINAVGQSLGPSLGQTPGSFAGLGQGLQQAQNLYGAGVYELYGAVANSLKAGAGGGFTQMGEDVVAMFDRAAAGATIDFQKGLGTRLQGIMSQGVSDLAQFGDVAGNIGKTFVNVAANLPGVGGDLLSTLQAGTGGLAKVTGFLGPALGPLLAFEAASRYGPTLVGGAGALLRNTGIGAAGLGNEIAAGSGEGFLSDALMGGGMGLVSAGGFLGGLGALPIGAAGALAYMIGKTVSYKTPYEQADAAILSNVAQQGPVAGIPAIISGMRQMAGVGYSRPAPNWQLGSLGGSLVNQAVEGKPVISGAMSYEAGQIRSTLASKMSGFGDVEKHWQGILSVGHDVLSMFGLEAPPPTPYQAAQKTLRSLSDTMVDALGTGKQVQGVWDGVSHSAISMAAANNVATMAAIQLGSAYEKNGQLTAKARTQIANLYAGYAPMVMNSGQFGAATGAMTAMSGLQGTQLASVNAAYDQLTGIVQGGASAAAGFFGLLSGTPVSSTRGGIRLAAAPARGSMAAALGSFTSAQGAAAWNTLTNTQTGQFPALEQQMDWLQTAQTLGALSSGQTTRMGAYEIAQMLPELGTNPAALSMLSPYAQRFGGPSFRPGESGAAMQKALSGWAQKNGLTNAGFNQLMTTGTEKLGSIGSDSDQFVQTVQSNLVGGMAQGVATYGASLQDAFMTAIGKGAMGGAAESQYLGFLKKSGVPAAGALDMSQYAGQLAGGSAKQLAALKEQVNLVYKMGAAPKLPAVTVDTKVKPPVMPPVPHPAPILYNTKVTPPVAPPAPPGGTVVYHSIVIGPGGGVAGAAGAGGHTIIGGQAGFKVPGYGGGDIWGPAMLEPGELVVPKDMVAGGAVDHLRGRIPGFQSGGYADPSVPYFPAMGAALRSAFEDLASQLVGDISQVAQQVTAASRSGGSTLYGPLQPSGGGSGPPVSVHVASVSRSVAASGLTGQLPMPASAMKALDAYEKTISGMSAPWKQFANELLQGLVANVGNPLHESAKQMQALISKVQTEVGYGQNVAVRRRAGAGLLRVRAGRAAVDVLRAGHPDHDRPGTALRLLHGSGGRRRRRDAVRPAADGRLPAGGEVVRRRPGQTDQGRPVEGAPAAADRRRATAGGPARAVHPRRGRGDQGRQLADGPDHQGIERAGHPGRRGGLRDAEGRGGDARESRERPGPRGHRGGAGGDQRHPRQAGDHPA